MNLWDPKIIRSIMGMYHLSFHKEFGQNFLTDPLVIDDIAAACADDPDVTVLEIGPGIGTLTQALAARYRRVVSLEIDRNLIPVLAYTLAGRDNVQIINADVLQTDLGALLAEDFAAGRVVVCANLPYYITSPILMKLLKSNLPFECITVMVQEEVANRICSSAGSRVYGAITVVTAYYGQAEKLFTVPANRFAPPPKVNSAVMRIRLWKEPPCRPQDESLLFRTVRAAFGQRRKTLANALGAGFPELGRDQIRGAIAHIGQELTVRGECLDIAQFTALSDYLAACLKEAKVPD